MNHLQNGSPALDMKRIEAAKANRQLQLENWRNYERQMQTSDKHPKKNCPRKSHHLNVKFTDNCVLLDATLRGDCEEVNQIVMTDPPVCSFFILAPFKRRESASYGIILKVARILLTTSLSFRGGNEFN
ncbi:unnamed protein product [Schistosoma mattheei]|uniref:Uncharacterized protein n=1 Tax=Schistosoma mattheei TaxID=31246 RepID=A0A183NVV4_9TREM|nr:unnamed protein product [Schistosoma mattheei]